MMQIMEFIQTELFQLLCTKRERIHGGISVMNNRGFDVLKEGIF